MDRPGVRFWDFHTVGADLQMPIAEKAGKTKPGPMLTRREYLCDASFLAALQGPAALIALLYDALKNPRWVPYLGRKSCVPSRPLLEHSPGHHPDLLAALCAIPWRPRLKGEQPPDQLEGVLDWQPTANEKEAPPYAQIWYDVPVSLDPPAHHPRFVIRQWLTLGREGHVALDSQPPLVSMPRAPERPRADYTNRAYREARKERLKADGGLCVFCKAPAQTVQHITYRRAGGSETQEDLRALCRLCHDAVTMLEYGHNMGLDRINPEDPQWREAILAKRTEIIQFRSLETRRRRLVEEEV